VKVFVFIYKVNKLFIVAVKHNNNISYYVDRASRYTCLKKTNKMHFSFDECLTVPRWWYVERKAN